jgi:hypothetical protein
VTADADGHAAARALPNAELADTLDHIASYAIDPGTRAEPLSAERRANRMLMREAARRLREETL